MRIWAAGFALQGIAWQVDSYILCSSLGKDSTSPPGMLRCSACVKLASWGGTGVVRYCAAGGPLLHSSLQAVRCWACP